MSGGSLATSSNVAYGWAWGGTRKLQAAALAFVMTVALYAGMPARSENAPAGVIVRAAQGLTSLAERSVVKAGGSIRRMIGIINGFSAIVPASSIASLQTAPGISAITPNSSIHLMSDNNSDPTSSSTYTSMTRVVKTVQANEAWSSHYTGSGVDVALIDSGVAPVDGLLAANKVINGPDLSFESQDANLRYLDSFGHGTHMAGIIAGKDRGDDPRFLGVAPDARLLSVKVAAGDGSTDVSQVLAAIDWVVQHRTDHGMNVRVLNLSFGTNSTQDYTIDPLAYAAEVAWRKGIVVVVAGGNNGTTAGILTDPAVDPYVIAVGAEDPNGTDGVENDTVPDFSSRGSATRHVDLVAPGKSVASLRVPGSFIDTQFPTARVGSRFFKGSGTSQSAAVVSGMAALLLQQRPSLSPDQVKAILMTSTKNITTTDPLAVGTGVANSKRARDSKVPNASVSLQTYPTSTGTGSLEQARGGAHVVDPNDVPLVGERDIFGHSWDGSSWSGSSWSGSSWSGGLWNGSSWSGSSWSGSSWSGSSWSGSSWSGSSWSGSSWSGSSWSGSSWSGGIWDGSSWSGRQWLGSSWSGSSWSGDLWSSSIWGD